jgi:hypothetical protein
MVQCGNSQRERSRLGKVGRRLLAFTLAAITVVGLTASCGGGSDLDLCHRYMQVLCERQSTCDPHAFVYYFYEDVDTCTQRESLLCPALLALPNTSFHGAAITSCTDDLENGSCDVFNGPLFGACATAFRGTLQGGDSCVDDFQCDSGSCAVPQVGPAYFRCGRCAPLVAAGAKCNAKDVCDVGLHCAGHVCTPPKMLGDSCVNVADCNVGLACLDGFCAHPRAEGDVCSNDHECNQSDLQYCEQTSQTCKPIPLPYWNGTCQELFSDGTEVDYPYCRAGFYCNVDELGNGKCAPYVADGDTCAGSKYDPCFPPAQCTADICQIAEVGSCGAP